MKKIIIAFDSFKGSLRSEQANAAVASVARDIFPEAEIHSLPMGDGGEGTARALAAHFGAVELTAPTRNPMRQPMMASYYYDADTRTAVIDSAAASGLPLVPVELRNPFHLSSYGTGMLMADAIARGARRIYLCVGGTATVDCGAGMLEALGAKFFGPDGDEIHQVVAGILPYVNEITLPALKDVDITVLVDVDNPLTGPHGAATVFGPQKGADPHTVKCLEINLKSMAGLVRDSFGIEIDHVQGAGAGGGIAAGALLLGARLLPGGEAVLAAAQFDKLLHGASLVITGEGRADATTARGKAAATILRHSAAQGVPVSLLAGSVENEKSLREMGFTHVLPITPASQSIAEAMEESNAINNLMRTAMDLLKNYVYL